MVNHCLIWIFFTAAEVMYFASTLKWDFLFLSQVWHRIPRQTDQREICAISLHTPTASSRLHYLDYSESAVHLKAQTTRLHTQDKTHSWGLLEWILKGWDMMCCWVHRNVWYNGEQVKQAHLRGAPSAISIAVIPKDQISLCNTHKEPGQSVFHMVSQHSALTHKHSAAVTL